MIGLEFAIVLVAIFIGTRLKGIGLGIVGGLGLAILTFCFGLKPTEPPFDVLLVILSVVIASSTLEAADGLYYLTELAEKLIRHYPQRITFIAPFVTYLFTFFLGTGHIVYSILPVIARVAEETGVRPERPLSVTVIAAQQAAIASPISAPTATIITLLAPYGLTLFGLLQVILPATLGGTLLASLVASKLGKGLHQDPVYLKKLQLGERVTSAKNDVSGYKATAISKLSVGLFILGIGLIVLLGADRDLRPSWCVAGKVVHMDMPTVIEIVMFSIAAFILLLCSVQPSKIVQSRVFMAGIQAIIAILGISWLGDTFFKANQSQIMDLVQVQIRQYPWQFSILLFSMSILLVSQTATIRALVPLALAIGIPTMTILASLPAVNGLFFIPSYPTILAAINLDATGTTRIGKLLLNHSFMLPGLVATITAVAIAFGLVSVFFGYA